mgnify:FL=1
MGSVQSDLPIIFISDGRNHKQSQTGPVAAFGGEERIEQVVALQSFRDSGAIVCDGQDRIFFVLRHNRALLKIGVAFGISFFQPDRDIAGTRIDCLKGVCQKVIQDHLQVLLVEAFNQDAGSDVTLDFDALRRQDRDFGNGFLEYLRKVTKCIIFLCETILLLK